MKPDLYTKAVLTVIALALVMIACNQYINPNTTAEAQGSFAGVQFGGDRDIKFFDTRTGEVWFYNTDGGKPFFHYQMTKLGQTLVKVARP